MREHCLLGPPFPGIDQRWEGVRERAHIFHVVQNWGGDGGERRGGREGSRGHGG